MLKGLRARLHNVWRRGTVEQEMEAEIREHLEQATALLVRRGLSPDEARAAARREFGNASMIAEDARVARGNPWFDDLRRDTRHAVRALRRTPGFSAIVITTLTLGFGVNGAIFAVLKGAMNPSPIADSATWVQLPALWRWSDYVYLHDSTVTLREMTAESDQNVVLAAAGASEEPEDAR